MKHSVTPSDESTNALDIGATLRQARETQGMSIASAAMQTNLRSVVIEQLENNEFAATGAPVFTRGYLSIYARFLRLDEDALLEAYNCRDCKQDGESLRINSVNIQSQKKRYKRSYTRQWLMLLLLLLLGGSLMTQLFNDQSWLLGQIRGAFAGQDINADATNDNANEQPEIVLEIASDDDNVSATPEPQPPALVLESVAEPSGDNLLTTLESNNTLSLSSLDDPSAMSSGDSIEPVSSSKPVGHVEANLAPEPQANSPALVLRTAQENWIEVKDDSGKILYSQIYQPGARIELAGDSPSYSLNIGRPSVVTLTLNGQERQLDSFRQTGHTRLFKVTVGNE